MCKFSHPICSLLAGEEKKYANDDVYKNMHCKDWLKGCIRRLWDV